MHNIKHIIYKYVMAALFPLSSFTMSAQENALFSDRLKSLQVTVGGEWGAAPVMLLGSNSWVDITFDDLQHSFQRYTYTIDHCNADWTRSDLLVSEYMTGFADNRLEDYEQSTTTEMEYNHFTLTLPNDDVRLLVSGNYRVNIFEDGEDEPVAQACFSVLEPHVGIQAVVSGNTDVDSWSTHQQLSFVVGYKGYQVQNPVSDMKMVVLQNRRWDTAVGDFPPTYMRTDELHYDHIPRLIFEAGNEYRRFEILDRYVPTMRVDNMRYEGGLYHARLLTDEQRTVYLYDSDQNGRYYVRNTDNIDNDTESDYFITHFRLQMPKIAGGEVYLNGELTNNRISEEYMLEYDPLDHAYIGAFPLKQGSYNYQYLFVRDGEERGTVIPCEGSFHQTDNEYSIYVYHRPFGLRYDKLVGFVTFVSKE